MKKLYKIALILAGIGLVAAIGTYLYVFHKPHRNIEKEKPAFIVDAETFYQEFSSNETASYEKYGNLVIQVKGPIADVSIEENQATIILLDDFEGISCDFDSLAVSTYIEKFKQLHIGETVEIKGKCDGFDMIMGVVLTRCVFVDE